MSGVVALYERTGETVDPKTLVEVLAAGIHRAVNGQHIWHHGAVALAHQHFWVTPEEQGEWQPLVLHDGQYAISFDGRLDNRNALIEALGLEVDGRSYSDAALALCAYTRWGEASVATLLGDFAYVIWDEYKRTLFIARDPLGVRSISYYCDNRQCIVASTVGQILAHPAVCPSLNHAAIAEYLIRYEGNKRESFFGGIEFCPPGCYVQIKAGSISTKQYWHIDLERTISYKSDDDYVEEFRKILLDAVEARLRFSGNIGISLSGGMDSASVTATAHTILEKQNRLPANGLSTYSYTFDQYPECDERVYIRAMSDRYSLRSTFLTADEFPVFSGVKEPMLSPDQILRTGGVSLVWGILNEMKRDGFQIQLTGSFGDILYEKQENWYWADDLLSDRLWRRLRTEMKQGHASGNDWARLVKRHFQRLLATKHVALRRHSQYQQTWNACGITPSLIKRTNLIERTFPGDRNASLGLSGKTAQAQAIHGDVYVKIRPVVDDWAHKLGITILEPYRDRRLVEFVLGVPGFIQGIPSSRKSILRRAMASHLPDVVLQRTAHSYLDSWIDDKFWRGTWLDLRDDLMREACIVELGFVREKWLANLVSCDIVGTNNQRYAWSAIMLENWLRAYG